MMYVTSLFLEEKKYQGISYYLPVKQKLNLVDLTTSTPTGLYFVIFFMLILY